MEKQLIENALGLTGKIMEDMMVLEVEEWASDISKEFSIEKFCYYLLSPEFIEKYTKINHRDFIYTSQDIGFSIHEYQAGSKQPLEDLLSKIK